MGSLVRLARGGVKSALSSLLLPVKQHQAARSLNAGASVLAGHSHDGVACDENHGGDDHGHSHGGEGNSSQAVDPQSGLPLNQRAKNVLAGNWRGQLTTIVAATRKA